MVIYLPKFKYPESKREVNNIMVGIVDKAVKVWVIFLRKIHFSNVFLQYTFRGKIPYTENWQ